MPRDFNGIELLPETRPPKQLYILLHGIGANGAEMLPLARQLQEHYPEAAFLLPTAPHPFEGEGIHRHQWYSETDVSEDNLSARVVACLPQLEKLIREAQDRLQVVPPDTALVGFAQGAIVALEYLKRHDGGVGRLLSFAGRYATLPEQSPEMTTLHLLHGDADEVIPASHTYAAYERLSALRGDVTIDIAAEIGHELHPALIDRAINRLMTCVPLRSWERALGLK